MNNASSAPANGATGGWIFRAVFLVLGAFAIYYVYKALFRSEVKRVVLIKDIHSAKTDANKPFVFDRTVLPPLYEGGEYSVSFWMYVNDWNYRFNQAKDVLSIANTRTPNGIVTLGLQLDAKDGRLHVLTSSVNNGTMASPTNASSQAPISQGTLTARAFDSMFNTQAGMGSNVSNDCAVGPVDLQRWVHVVVALNGKTVDVYMNGKLARSCILPSIFKVDSQGYTVNVAGHSGFGGFISGVAASDYAMNPEQVYRTYQAGPLGDIGLLDYLKSFFDPSAIGTLDYPKMNN